MQVFLRKKINKNYTTYKIYTYISHHQLHIQTLHIIQNEVLTMDIKHLSNRQLSKKVVQCIYLVYRIAMGFIQLSFGMLVKLAIDIIRL